MRWQRSCRTFMYQIGNCGPTQSREGHLVVIQLPEGDAVRVDVGFGRGIVALQYLRSAVGHRAYSRLLQLLLQTRKKRSRRLVDRTTRFDQT